MGNLDYLEGRRFCVVFVKVLDEMSGRMQFQCFRGRADIRGGGRLHVVAPDGAEFQVPGSAHGMIQPADGTAMLRDAEYFVLVKTDPRIDLSPRTPEIPE